MFWSRKRQVSPETQRVREEAAQLLAEARRLLRESDQNVDEAMRLRFRIIDEVLPDRNFGFLSREQRALMRDVDRQIQYAYIRLAKKSFTPQESKMQQQALSSQISLDLKSQERNRMYREIKLRDQQQKLMYTVLGLLGLMILGTILIVLWRQYGVNDAFNQSFQWMNR